MNTYELERVIRQYVKCFDGVFSSDRLPTKPRLLVCNNDWEVALTEISVPDMFHNVKKDSCFLMLTEAFSRRYTIAIEDITSRSTS